MHTFIYTYKHNTYIVHTYIYNYIHTYMILLFNCYITFSSHSVAKTKTRPPRQRPPLKPRSQVICEINEYVCMYVCILNHVYVCMYVCMYSCREDRKDGEEGAGGRRSSSSRCQDPTHATARRRSFQGNVCMCMYMWRELILLVTGSEATCAPSYIHYTCPG